MFEAINSTATRWEPKRSKSSASDRKALRTPPGTALAGSSDKASTASSQLPAAVPEDHAAEAASGAMLGLPPLELTAESQSAE